MFRKLIIFGIVLLMSLSVGFAATSAINPYWSTAYTLSEAGTSNVVRFIPYRNYFTGAPVVSDSTLGNNVGDPFLIEVM